MPGAVDIKIFLGGLLAPGDPVAHFLLKNLRPAACQRIQPKRLEFLQHFGDRFFRKPGEVHDFDRGEALELQPIVHRLQFANHVGVVAVRQRRMQPADNVQFGDPDGESLLRLFHHVRHGQFEAVGVPFFRENAQNWQLRMQ